MGFSVLSLIEIVYFITLRPYCKSVQQHRSKAKSKSKVPNSQQSTSVTHSNGLMLVSPSDGYRHNGYDQPQPVQPQFNLARGKLNRNAMRARHRIDWINNPYMN